MIASFLTSKMGIRIAAIGTAILSALIVISRVFSAGKRSAQAESAERSIDRVRAKAQVYKRIDEEVRDEKRENPDRSIADIKRDRLLNRWARD
jgi:hypothetical protein